MNEQMGRCRKLPQPLLTHSHLFCIHVVQQECNVAPMRHTRASGASGMVV